MNLFEVLDLITNNRFDSLELPSEVLLEIMPEIYNPIAEHIKESESLEGKRKKCLYVDKDSYILNEKDGTIQLVYIKEIKEDDIIYKRHYFIMENQLVSYLNNYTLSSYHKIHNKEIICFVLELYNTVETGGRDFYYYHSWDILSYLMGYWKQYINSNITRIEKGIGTSVMFKADLKGYFGNLKTKLPEAKEIEVDFTIKRRYSFKNEPEK